jgi:hypothetical protein
METQSGPPSSGPVLPDQRGTVVEHEEDQKAGSGDDPVPAREQDDLGTEVDQEEQAEAEADRTTATGRLAGLPVGGEAEDRIHHD